jgi:hypothetical protein
VFYVGGFVFVGEFGGDEVDLFGGQEGGELLSLGNGPQLLKNPQQAFFPHIIPQSQAKLQHFSFGGINLLNNLPQRLNLGLLLFQFLPHSINLVLIGLIMIILQLLHFEYMLLPFDL